MKRVAILLLLIMISCSSKVECKKYLSDAGIKLTAPYSLKESEYNKLGDLKVKFRIGLYKDDVKNITNQIINTPGYKVFKGSSTFPTSDFNSDKISAYKLGRVYYYEVHKSKINKHYTISLNDESILTFWLTEK